MARDAYALSGGLAPAQRVSLLTRLLYTLRPEVMAAEKRRWAGELFEQAQRLPTERAASRVPSAPLVGLRNQAIATAAARLAIYDSDRALELLDTLPSQGGRREDPRTMAARLVFPLYLRHHGAAGVQTLLAHAAEWGEHGGFPYAASAAALARLNGGDQAAEDFFRQALAVFARGNEGAFGIAEFGELLERAAAMEAISEDAAEEAGRAIVAQAAKLARARGGDAAEAELLPSAGGASAPAAGKSGGVPGKPDARVLGRNGPEAQDGGKRGDLDAGAGGIGAGGIEAAPEVPEGSGSNSLEPPLSEEAQQRLAAALNDVRLAAPKAYAQAAKQWPALARLRAVHVVSPVKELKVDAGLQASFAELAATIGEHRGPEALNEGIRRGLQRVNARYRAGACSACLAPDAQSSAFVSLAAYGSPWTIGTQLKAIEEPFWRAYFLAIAAQQVGEPTRVADPTARRVIQKEEAEPEDEDEEGGAE